MSDDDTERGEPGDRTSTSAADAPTDSTAEVDASDPGSGVTAARLLLVAIGGILAVVVGVGLFVVLPADLADLAGVVLALLTVAVGVRATARGARAVLPDYNVAAVTVEGPITRDSGPMGPLGRVAGTAADDVVTEIEAADEDDAVEALLVELNTPGGEVVPSDDIRTAVQRFDGPTVAYALDVCASGGYWIASGCDEVWARDATLVGSIGVIGSRPNVSGLADRLGVTYERYTAGRYKDAGSPLKQPNDEDREYLQGLIDELYDDFVERVADGRELAPEAVRETEAKVFLGRNATENGLVDEIGTRHDVEERLETLLGVEPSVAQFEPDTGIAQRLRAGTERVAAAAGAGVADTLTPDDEVRFRL